MRRAVWVASLLALGSLLPHAPAQAQGSGTSSDRPRLLFLTYAGLYKHASLEAAEHTVTDLGREGGFDVTTLQGYQYEPEELDLAFLTADYLAQFDGLMMMTNGNLPLTDDQKAAIVAFVRDGKGFIGVHNAALTLYDYPPFGEMLGAYFRRPISQERPFTLRVEDHDHPATRMLDSTWTLQDEFYQFGTAAWDPAHPDDNVDVLFGNRIPVGLSRDRVHVLLSIDTRASDIEGIPDMVPEGDYPQAWYQNFGEGRSFYTALGHTEALWTGNATFRAHLLGGIRWALGLED